MRTTVKRMFVTTSSAASIQPIVEINRTNKIRISTEYHGLLENPLGLQVCHTVVIDEMHCALRYEIFLCSPLKAQFVHATLRHNKDDKMKGGSDRIKREM
jgi:hypothetical protein